MLNDKLYGSDHAPGLVNIYRTICFKIPPHLPVHNHNNNYVQMGTKIHKLADKEKRCFEDSNNEEHPDYIIILASHEQAPSDVCHRGTNCPLTAL